MEKCIDNFIPPYLISFPTGKISLCYVGPKAEWQPRDRTALLRRGSSGHLSIYCDLEKDHSHVILALCFQEDDLPSLHRQVYYHYLDSDDTIIVNGELVEIAFQNMPQEQDGSDNYKSRIAWLVQFNKRHLDTVRTILTQVRPLTANMPKISSLCKEDRELLYYDLRATLMPQPIPRRLGAVGKWQNRIPAGCPQFPSPISNTYNLVSHHVGRSMPEEDEDEEPMGSTTPIAIKVREKERERNMNGHASPPPPSPPRNKNNVPAPRHEDEGFHETIDSIPQTWDTPKFEPPTPTPARVRGPTNVDAFVSPVGNPGKMALRNKGHLAATEGKNERRVSIQGTWNNKPVTMEFDTRYVIFPLDF
ncbi:hypothetical protein QBC40DRAFT_164522 [Triangularia verruculosa]|uniref:Uncharacterized protein n=1 Tax=Triangularia verruculosa TaxID=2587418 RepID=A0AAN7AZF2_9PEZI|nr:hypothetical protein QBC40DRAFT_164522 [Triangularia verruculosa]